MADHDQTNERWLAARISEASGDRVANGLLTGQTLRGVRDDELASLAVPAAVMASSPENPIHRRATATALVGLLANPVSLPPMPEAPVAGFEPTRFAEAIERWVDTAGPAA